MTTPAGGDQEPQHPDQPDQPDRPAYPQYGDPQYGDPQYGDPQYGYPQTQHAPDHPRSTTALVLGILSVVLCQLIGPFAWQIGRRTLNEIDAAQGRLGGRGAAQAGYVLGIIGTALLGLALLYLAFIVVVVVGAVVYGNA